MPLRLLRSERSRGGKPRGLEDAPAQAGFGSSRRTCHPASLGPLAPCCQVFLDVVESVNLLVNSNGSVVRSEVVGALKMRAYLSGMVSNCPHA